MILIAIAIGLTIAALLLHFWPRIITFLQGPCRDYLEGTIGASSVQWYLKFLCWLDSSACFTLRAVKLAWQKFSKTILSLTSTYHRQDDGLYRKTSVSVIRLNDTQAKRIVHEETVSCDELPTEIQEKMRQENDESQLDMRELVKEKTIARCRDEEFPEEEILLSC